MSTRNAEPGTWNAPPPRSRTKTERARLVAVVVVLVLGCLIAPAFWFRRPPPAPSAPLPVRAAAPATAAPDVAFVDITRTAGITFEHENGADGQKLLPETMGGGVVFFDYNNDRSEERRVGKECRARGGAEHARK